MMPFSITTTVLEYFRQFDLELKLMSKGKEVPPRIHGLESKGDYLSMRALPEGSVSFGFSYDTIEELWEDWENLAMTHFSWKQTYQLLWDNRALPDFKETLEQAFQTRRIEETLTLTLPPKAKFTAQDLPLNWKEQMALDYAQGFMQHPILNRSHFDLFEKFWTLQENAFLKTQLPPRLMSSLSRL